MTEDIYRRLAKHFSELGMALVDAPGLEEILKANFTPLEAEIALALPTKVGPMDPVTVDEIAAKVNIPREELINTLERMAKTSLVFAGKTASGERGYALVQSSYGFPQVFYWSGEESEHAKKMTGLMKNYMNRDLLARTYGSTPTKSFRFIPVGETIETKGQTVLPYDMMDKIIENAKSIAVAHCPCRVMNRIKGRPCNHPEEVCLKYDELADYVIERGMGRRVSKEEALKIIKKSEDLGLVHFVDNAAGGIKHT